MATFTRLAVPQDQQFVLSNGAINPAWYRYLLQLQAMQPELISLNSDTSSVTARVTTAEGAIDATEARLDALEGNLQQPSMSDVAINGFTAAASYDVAQMQIVSDTLDLYGAALNTLIARLEAAKVLEE